MAYVGATPAKIPLTSSDIEDGIITADKLATDAVETAKVKDVNVTAGKLATTQDLSSKTITLPATVAGLGTGINVTNQITGVVPAANLGSGTASSSTYLAGDSTYKALSEYDDNKIQSNIALLGFKCAVNGSLAKYNLQDQIIDEYEDATGIDAGNSTNETLDSGSYSGSAVVSPTQDADATGTDGDYTWYKWTDTASTGSYTPAGNHDADFLVIAGGGGGGGDAANGGGGGGAGGYRNSFASEATGGGGSNEAAVSLVNGTTYTITVGAGGAAGGTGSDGGVSSITGSDITDITTVGGGGGATAGSGGSGGVGRSGGSGSGKGRDAGSAGTGGAGTANQGYAGGTAGGSTASSAGGGGGAGAVGYDGHYPDGAADPWTTGDTWANGGVGLTSSIDGSATFRGGGGAGSYENSAGVGQQPQGGNGGGGNGATSSTENAGTAGTANTGGGGGAGKWAVAAGAGGSGIVIIRKLTSGLAYNDLTLQSTDTTAMAEPDYADMIILMENNAGTATINTDIKGYISKDSGSTFTQGTLVDEGTWGTNKKIYAFHDLDISAQSGTSMCYKITTHNQAVDKITKIHATSIGWKA